MADQVEEQENQGAPAPSMSPRDRAVFLLAATAVFALGALAMGWNAHGAAHTEYTDAVNPAGLFVIFCVFLTFLAGMMLAMGIYHLACAVLEYKWKNEPGIEGYEDDGPSTPPSPNDN